LIGLKKGNLPYIIKIDTLIYTKDKEFMIKLGQRIKLLRHEKGISQEELSLISDVSLPQITRIERGVINPTICTLKSLSKGLKINISQLLDFDY
jgi:ribosome-binding protein aMBF1 (putative translation factor)